MSSKGFFEEITVQDFPIRGHQVYLHITRRRWLNEDTDMATNIGLIAKKWFPNATRVTNHFHVQKLATEALQEIRIKYRWQAIDQENEAIKKKKKKKAREGSSLRS